MKRIFKSVLLFLQMLPGKIVYFKIFVFEWMEIFRKRSLYSEVRWTKEQKEEFDEYWKKNYGKKISSRWHKLYQSINGVFDVSYLPDIIYFKKVEPKINEYNKSRVYQDKAIIEIFSNAADVKVPETILLNSDGIFYDSDRNVVNKEDALRILKSKDVAVVKPTIGGSSGNGVAIIEMRGLSIQQCDKLLEKYKSNYIFQEKIKQHETFEKLHPESINTIRLITVATEEGIYHWPLSMRIGTGCSTVDNIHAGGLVIGVSDEGILQQDAYLLGYCDQKRKCKIHPNSGIVFSGYRLENVSEIIKAAERLHKSIPGIGMVSWDFTLSQNGEPIVIEANILGQSIWFPQIVNKKGVADKILPLIRRIG